MSDYLLDVNVLVAHAIIDHVHHRQVVGWCDRTGRDGRALHVSPIVELGLVRNVMRIGALPIHSAGQILANEYVNLNLRRIPDSIGAENLPNWVRGYRQTTDAYLSRLAEAHQLILLTIDKGIPGARRILSESP